jgi:integrase
MTTSYRDGSPVWEIRVVVGFDPAHGHSVQRSFTVHGDEAYALQRRCELVEDYGVGRVGSSDIPGLNVAELLERFIVAPHLWKPATFASHRHVVGGLIADSLGRRPLLTLSAGTVRSAILRWQTCGLSVATVSARWLVLRSAISWAVTEGLLRSNPLAGVRGPPRPRPRLHHTAEEVHRMLTLAETDVARLSATLATEPSSLRWRRLLFSAEQALLLVRVADSGARRGELAVLRYGDLDGRVLTIQRSVSHGVVGTTESNRTRRLTLGTTTAALVESHWSSWLQRGPVPDGEWLFAPTPARDRFVTADALSHKFRRLGVAAGVERPALHRLRHAVATQLVADGRLLQAQARLGHRDPTTTLRHYAHAVALHDEDVADALDELLNGRPRAVAAVAPG